MSIDSINGFYQLKTNYDIDKNDRLSNQTKDDVSIMQFPDSNENVSANIQNLAMLGTDTKVSDDVEADSNSKTEEIRNAILNPDGSINGAVAAEMFSNGEITMDDLMEAFDGEVTYDDDCEFVYTLDNGYWFYTCLNEAQLTDDGFLIGTQFLAGTTDENGVDLTEAEGFLVTYNPNEMTKEEIEKYEKIKNQFTNEDGSLNITNLGQLIESGEISISDFIGACGYNIRNPQDQSAINLTRSDTFSFTLDDGTVVRGLISDWTGNRRPFLSLTTPSGEQYVFEYNKPNDAD